MGQPSILIVLALAYLATRHRATAQPPTTPTYRKGLCDIRYGNYASNSLYSSNLIDMLKIITAQANLNTFSEANAGLGDDKVYGQYYCRADLGLPFCTDCINKAVAEIQTICSTFRVALMFYEECTLRYGDQYIGGQIAQTPAYNESSVDPVTDPSAFQSVLDETIDKVFQTASYDDGLFHFGTGEGVVSPSETVYLLSQCIRDLDGAQCSKCLWLANNAYWNSTGGYWPKWSMVFLPSCQIRYSIEGPFYALPNATTSSPPSPRKPFDDATQAPPPTTKLAPRSESATATNGKGSAYYVKWAVIPAVTFGLLILLGNAFCLIKRNRSFSFKRHRFATEDGDEERDLQDLECLQFDLNSIEAATNGFSISNILGRGGFGMVYKGVLKDGQEIAVKRLSKNSRQGTTEFKTEVAVVAKLQHKNLVRLVGCCIDGEERILVYEFLRNLSLDGFLYDGTKSAYLAWDVRQKIIKGIARGLHYLHEDSRVKIVHRDLKISNILLDDNLDPKIADFGLAKLVMVDQTSNHTAKVVGTYGYMSPEYALAGRYSTKSDVYSFGIIVLEILSGEVSSRFYETSQGEGLLNYAWRVWNEGTIEKLMDPVLQNDYSRIEAERCLQIGLLCVQDDESNRPPMNAVLVMLNSNNAEISSPFTPVAFQLHQQALTT